MRLYQHCIVVKQKELQSSEVQSVLIILIKVSYDAHKPQPQCLSLPANIHENLKVCYMQTE